MRKPLFILIAVGAISLWGCYSDADNPTQTRTTGEDTSTETDTTDAGAVTEEYAEAFKATGDLVATTQAELAEQVNQRIEKIDDQLEQLETKLAGLTEQAAAGGREAIAELKAKRDAIAKDLQSLQSASGNAWKEMQSGFEAAFEELDQAYDQAVQELKHDPASGTGSTGG